jgi:3'-phosphoadenosine 5'-phosphosulfate sulfotransferase (PAPS reductase)/FAD synthetase
MMRAKFELDDATRDAIERHDRIALLFSGGKDSTAALFLVRSYWPKIIVIWGDAGDSAPETFAQMRHIAAMVPNFHRVGGHAPAFVAQHGLPVDLMAVRSTEFGKIVGRNDDAKVVGWVACCNANIWQPLRRTITELGCTLEIRGERSDDLRRPPVAPGAINDGVEIALPVWAWTNADVLAYLEEIGERPLNYSAMGTGLDCIHCTAHLCETAGKLRYLDQHLPEAAAEVRRRLQLISGPIFAELRHLQRALAE